MYTNKKVRLYYLLQFLGWGIYTGSVGFSIAKKIDVSIKLMLFLAAIFLFNIMTSNLYRALAIRTKWFNGNVFLLIIKVLVSSSLLGVLFSVAINFFNIVINQVNDSLIDLNTFITGSFLYFIWNLIYLAYQYFDQFKIEELKNVKLQMLKNEVELQNLRSQMNPHFMFNAMNSIRALVDEDPKQAKIAITKLSNILRNALIHSKDRLITLKQEIDFVSDYLALEKIRYEERLTVLIDIPKECYQTKIPPLLIQTLVENGIKHGISTLVEGGIIEIIAKNYDNKTEISVINSGILDKKNSETGVGVENTVKRLDLEFGDEATFHIKSLDEKKVEAVLKVPSA